MMQNTSYGSKIANRLVNPNPLFPCLAITYIFVHTITKLKSSNENSTSLWEKLHSRDQVSGLEAMECLSKHMEKEIES